MSVLQVRIRELRETKGLSQEQLAQEVDTSQRQISKYENGKQEPTAHVLFSLADALDTTTDYLLGRTNIRDRPLRNEGDLTTQERAALTAWRKGNTVEAIHIISGEGLKKIVMMS